MTKDIVNQNSSQITDIDKPQKNIRMPRFIGLTLSCLILGILIGLSSGLLSLFLDGTEKIFLGFVESSSEPGPFSVPAIRRLISVVVGSVIAAAIWWYLRNKTLKVPSVSQAVAGAKMPVWQTLVHILTQIFLVGTGASLGREVAPREAGALIGGVWCRYSRILGLDKKDRRMLVAAAAGAGFAGIYISPLTGALFGIEVLLSAVDLTSVVVCLSMSSVATIVGGSIKGFDPYYAVGTQEFSHGILLFALVAGVFAGLIGVYFRRLTVWAESNQATGKEILWLLPGAGFITGLVALILPGVMGNGRAIAQISMDLSYMMKTEAAGESIHFVLFFFAALGIWKIICTTLTIRAGASGGTLTPAISIGASLGVILGIMSSMCGFDIPFWQTAVIGAAATLAASQQAPLMALFMLFEVCHLPASALLPLAVAVVVSTGVSRKCLSNNRVTIDFKSTGRL